VEPVPSPSRRVRLLSAAIVLIVLLGIVAFASNNGIGRSQEGGPSADYLSYAYSAFLVVFLLAIPATLWAVWVESTRVTVERPTFRRAVIQNLLTFGVLCLLVGGALYLRQHGFTIHKPDTHALNNTHKAITQNEGKPVTVEPTFKWPVLVVALVLLAIAAVPVVREYRRRKARRREALLWEPRLADELSDELSLALDDLRTERDIRRAVIAAYARMEKVLAQRGVRRRVSETALEYLARVLQDLRVTPAAAEGLTQLFEEAKFSRHDLGEDGRTRAIGALETVRSDLAPAAS
jgi:hypothetical protein